MFSSDSALAMFAVKLPACSALMRVRSLNKVRSRSKSADHREGTSLLEGRHIQPNAKMSPRCSVATPLEPNQLRVRRDEE